MKVYNEIKNEKEKIIKNLQKKSITNPTNRVYTFLFIIFCIILLFSFSSFILSLILSIYLKTQSFQLLIMLLFSFTSLLVVLLCTRKFKVSYSKRENESITLYEEYFEHKYETKNDIFIYKIFYKDITTFHLFDREELLISANKIQIKCKNKKTLSNTEKILTKDESGIKQHKVLFCFEYGDEMFEDIQKEIELCSIEYRNTNIKKIDEIT